MSRWTARRLLAGKSGGGGVAYLWKDRIADAEALPTGSVAWSRGETVVEPMLIDELLAARPVDDPIARLTDRESEVFAAMAQGPDGPKHRQDLVITRKAVEARFGTSSASWTF
jgi:hypothetical protein